MLVCLQDFRHRYLFPSHLEFRCGEPDGEGERSRPSPLPFLFGQRMQSPLSECFLFAVSFRFTLARELPLQVCPRLDFSLWNENPWFVAQPQSAIITLIVATSCLLSVDLQQIFQFFRLFQLASCSDSPTRCQLVNLQIKLRPTCVEGLNAVVI